MYKIAINIYRLSIGSLIAVAILTQFLTFRQTPGNFFSYFTILSNLFMAFFFIFSSFKKIERRQDSMIRGAITLYLLITSLGFILLLGGKNDEFFEWVNAVVHYISPIIIFFDWIIIPTTKLSFKKSLIWLLVPLLYLVYSLVRGSITSWYPYGFLNPNEVGVSGLFIYSAILLTGSLFLSWIIVMVSGRTNSSQ